MKEGKNKGLWHNIRKRREKGLPRKKPGQEGYPETLDIDEAALRSLIRTAISESGEMFYGRDLSAMKSSQMAVALEEVIMDLQDIGCPIDSPAMAKTREAHDYFQSGGSGTGRDIERMVEYAIEEIENCVYIDEGAASEIAQKLSAALYEYRGDDNY
jgi:hypothetical protein